MTGDDRPLISLGVDIGKTAHYAVAVDREGQTVYSKAIANEESALRLLVLWARAHQAMVIVDQPGGTAALLLKLCWDATIDIGYVPGLAMARAVTSMRVIPKPIQRMLSFLRTSLVLIRAGWSGCAKPRRLARSWNCSTAMMPTCVRMRIA